MAIHVFTNEVEFDYVGWPDMTVGAGHEDYEDARVVTAIVGTDSEREDGAVGGWLTLRLDAATAQELGLHLLQAGSGRYG